MDPLYLKEIRLSRGPQGARLDATITNIKVFGANTFVVQELKYVALTSRHSSCRPTAATALGSIMPV